MGCSNSKKNIEINNVPTSRKTSIATSQRRTLNIENVDLILKNDHLVTDDYEVVNFLGRGAFSSVYKVKHLKSDSIRAIKEFKKNPKKKQLPNEIAIQRSMSHPHITKAFEWFEDKEYYYLVTEYLQGGDLLEAIGKITLFGEVEVANIMKQLLSSVSYLHSKYIVHRDLKPNNIMLEVQPDGGELSIKLIDFGLAEYCKPDQTLSEYAGTPIFMSPEVIKGSYNNKYDIWSCGIIMHILLFGESPYDKFIDDTKVLKSAIKAANFDLDKYHGVSQGSKDFLLRLLEPNHTFRPNADECLQDPWLVEYSLKGRSRPQIDIDLKKNLSKFLSKDLLQQACSAYLLYHYENSERTKKLKKVFQEMDKSGDGKLTYAELKEGFKKMIKDPFFENNFDNLWQQINSDGGEFVEYDEFLRAMGEMDELLSDNLLKEAFDYFDTDKSGTLCAENLRDALKLAGDSVEDKELIKKIIAEVDYNGDGEISFSEFKSLMLKIKE